MKKMTFSVDSYDGSSSFSLLTAAVNQNINTTSLLLLTEKVYKVWTNMFF